MTSLPRPPRLSVIVPAFQAEAYLPLTLEALDSSDLPRAEWELIVVDDGSHDRTSSVASRWADRVVTLPAPPRGPAYARNSGAQVARGDWLVFVDADVQVLPTTLRSVTEAIAAPGKLVALFGTYDANPPAPGIVSQFRNLHHRYVHLRCAGPVDTFWAGCGAVERTAFLAVGGFDATRFPRPQIEDIDLGYRLRDRGGEIRVDTRVQGAHLKNWTFRGGTVTDLFHRGVPWVQLLHERGGLIRDESLNLKSGERAKTLLVGAGVGSLAAGLVAGPPAFGVGIILLVVVVAWDLPALRWFARLRGWSFAACAAGLLLWYHFISGLSVVLGTLAYAWRQLRRSQGTTTRLVRRLTPLTPGE